ncbi:MAG: hypothetical protein ABJI96_01405 [Paracoccaceae bacterium]
MSFIEVLSLVANAVIAISAAAGASAAWQGLNTWKNQANFETNHDLARKILVQFFRHRDAISTVRNPIMWAHETRAAIQMVEVDQRDVGEEKKNFLGIAYAYDDRWQQITKVRAELYPLLLEADAIWGSELDSLVQPLFVLEGELSSYIHRQLRVDNPDNTKGRREAAQRSLEKSRDVMHADFGDEDEYKIDYDTKLKAVEDFLRVKLGNRI